MTAKTRDMELMYYEERHYNQVCEYNLDETQKDFTALPREAISRFKDNPACELIVMITHNNPVGFFVLHKGEDVLQDENAKGSMLIRSLSVNPVYQGKGLAQKAMRMLPSFVKKNHPDMLELFLMVNEGNLRAYHVYKKVGYMVRGLRREGPHGMQKVLHYKL